jgi:hypothetical protein
MSIYRDGSPSTRAKMTGRSRDVAPAWAVLAAQPSTEDHFRTKLTKSRL